MAVQSCLADGTVALLELGRYREARQELNIALGKLREEYRTCFVLFYVQELSCAQIGDMLGCPQVTVKTWLHRARKILAETLQRRGVVTEKGYELHRI